MSTHPSQVGVHHRGPEADKKAGAADRMTPGWRTAVLLRSSDLEKRLTLELAGVIKVLISHSELEFWSTLPQSRLASVLLEPPPEVSQSLLRRVAELHRQRPWLPVILYLRPEPDISRFVIPLVKAGANQVLLNGFDDVADAIGRTAQISASNRPRNHLIREVLPRVPEGCHAFVEFCILNSDRATTVTDAVEAINIRRRTLEFMLHSCGWPSPAELIADIRVLAAVTALAFSNQTVEEAAHNNGFSSAAALTNMTYRHFHCSPREASQPRRRKALVTDLIRRFARQPLGRQR